MIINKNMNYIIHIQLFHVIYLNDLTKITYFGEVGNNKFQKELWNNIYTKEKDNLLIIRHVRI